MRNRREGKDERAARPETSVDGAGALADLHPVLGSVFSALNAAGVRWCLLRRPSNLAIPAGDVDLLVDPEEDGRTRTILEALGFGRLPVWGRRYPETFYLLYHPPTDHNVCLHVATGLAFGPDRTVRTGAATGCLRRRRRYGPLFEPTPDDAFWILLLHCLLDKGAVPSRHRTTLKKLADAARADGELAVEAAALSPVGTSPSPWDATGLLALVRNGDWASLEGLARRLRGSENAARLLFDRALQAASTLRGLLSSRSIRRYARRKARGLARAAVGRAGWGGPSLLAGRRTERGGTSRGANRPRGLTVALMGPDGVGKSSLADGVRDSFAPHEVRKLYMGLGYAGLPRLARLPVPGSRAAVGLLTLWWRSLVARRHKERGGLVVFDRYTYDALLPPERRLNAPQRVARWVWAHSCPAPDLVLLLDAPGEVVYERRREGDPESLEAARRGFLSLRGRVPGLQVVNAARPEEAVRADVLARIQDQGLKVKGSS